MTTPEVLPLRWTVSHGGLVRSAGPFGERAVIDPTGTLLAWLPPRTRPVGLAERERVRVSSVETGEVIAAMPGPAVVRTLHWLRSDRVVIARDARGGMLLQLVEVPPGEVLAEAFLPGRSEQRFDMSHTPDGRTLCVVEHRTRFEGPCAVWRLDGETLALRGAAAQVEPETEVHLHPDGQRILYVEEEPQNDKQRSRWTARVVPAEAPVWEMTLLTDEVVSVAWCGRDHALAQVDRISFEQARAWSGDSIFQRVVWHEMDLARGATVRSGELGGAPFREATLSPDGARIATVRLWPAPQGSAEGAFAEVLSNHVLSTGATERTRLELPPPLAEGEITATWTPDGTGLVLAVSSALSGTRLAMPRGDGTARVFTHEITNGSWWGHAVIVCGRYVVEYPGGEHAIRLTDLAALV